MLYIKFTKDYFKEFKKEEKFSSFTKRIIYAWKILRGGFFKKNIENGELIILPRINKKTKRNLFRYLSLFNVRTICLSENLRNTEMLGDIENLGVKVLDGQWLYKYLIKNIVQYITLQKGSEIESQEISILINNITDVDIENIIMLAEICKNINVVTSNELKLKKIEAYLYNEKGIILNITQNYSKSLIKSDIIINVDLEEAELNKYVFPRKAVVVSVESSAKVLNKGFDGINISSYKISIPEKYINGELNLECFNKEILYESYLYRKTNPKNIINIIDNDELKIEFLEGSNGKISKNEYIRLQPNRR